MDGCQAGILGEGQPNWEQQGASLRHYPVGWLWKYAAFVMCCGSIKLTGCLDRFWRRFWKARQGGPEAVLPILLDIQQLDGIEAQPRQGQAPIECRRSFRVVRARPIIKGSRLPLSEKGAVTFPKARWGRR